MIRFHLNVCSVLLCLLLMIAAGVTTAKAQEDPEKKEGKSGQTAFSPDMKLLIDADEEFVYKVRYGFFTLGKVYVKILGDSLHNGRKTYHLQTTIKSNSSIPFMGREVNRYHSLMYIADSTPRTSVFWFDNIDEGIKNEYRYEFDRSDQKVYTYEKGAPKDTLELEEPASSGHFLFYFSRIFAGTGQSYRIPIYIDHEKGYLRASNSRRREIREYEAFEKPVEAYMTTGHADVDGPFGFSGDFKAWFAADPLRIPLEAHVKVWIGNVKVRLIKYSR